MSQGTVVRLYLVRSRLSLFPIGTISYAIVQYIYIYIYIYIYVYMYNYLS